MIINSTYSQQQETLRPRISRRGFERLPIELAVNIQSEHNFFTGFSRNLSEGGLFIATHVLRPVGALLEVTFTLPGDEKPVVARVEVRWVKEYREGSDGWPGLGLRFVSMDPEDARRIEAFMKNDRDPLFFDE
jgi:uncharacterized protein (TIGR02266 family)